MKMGFHEIEDVYSSLLLAFHPELIGVGAEAGDVKVDMKTEFIALWTLFLKCSGWTEDEFLEESENHYSDDEEDLFDDEPSITTKKDLLN